jgi:hypothetical protein
MTIIRKVKQKRIRGAGTVERKPNYIYRKFSNDDLTIEKVYIKIYAIPRYRR